MIVQEQKLYQVTMTLTISAQDIDEADQTLDEVLDNMEEFVEEIDTAVLEEAVNGN